VPDPENGKIHVRVRRRRTRRHRRNRLIRRSLAFAIFAVLTAGVSTLALMYFSPSLFRASQSTPPAAEQHQVGRNGPVTFNPVLSNVRPPRPVYPYSVVPGGVADAKELKWVAEHDPVVAAHYAGFDYDHAQVVRLTLARTVYVSYRIGNRIYWTRRRVKLRKGETLITDGRMTARTRCANRVEETAQQEASPVEPPVQKFDQPARAGRGTSTQAPPVLFESALLNRPEAPGLGPMGPLSLYNPFVGGGGVSISPPPLPVGLCAPPVKKKGSSGIDGGTDLGAKKKKVPGGPCGNGSGSLGIVPEPGTWIMFASGLAAIYWQARRRLARI
jgi:PEP-CTERM motif